MHIKINPKTRKRIGKVLQKYFYIKLCFNRVYSGYVGIFLDLIRDVTITTAALKIIFPQIHLVFIIPTCLVMISGIIFLGHIEITNKFAHIEQHVGNQLNPHLMSIYNKVNKKTK